MFKGLAARRWVAFATLACLCVALFAPTLARAFNGQPAVTWAQVCSAAGMRWVQLDDGAPTARTTQADPGAPQSDPDALGHCPYCAFHLDTLAAAPAAPTVRASPLVGLAMFPPAFLAAPRTLHVWASARARAPPIPQV